MGDNMFTRSKEKDVPIVNKLPSANPFDPKIIKKCIYDTLLEGWPQKRVRTGMFVIESFWKNGSLNRFDIDGQNVTDLIDKMNTETALEKLLINSKRFRRNYSGKIKLTIKIKDGDVTSLYNEDGNFIPFSPDEIDKYVENIIPEGWPQKRLDNGLFVIECFMKHGEIKKIDIDQQDLIEVNISKLEKDFEDLLTASKRFRRNYTGRMKLTVKKKNNKIISIYKEEGNFIITELTNNNGRY
jgi:translation initiation factor IF-1